MEIIGLHYQGVVEEAPGGNKAGGIQNDNHRGVRAIYIQCGGPEDHAHATKKCAALDPMKKIIRSRWRPLVLEDNTWVEPSRMCKEHVGLSVTTVQGLLMWTSMLAKWLVRCNMINGREEEHEHRVLRRMYAVLSTWGTVLDLVLGMDHVREAQRIITSHMRRSPQRLLVERDPGGPHG